jgi:hypothetical protein
VATPSASSRVTVPDAGVPDGVIDIVVRLPSPAAVRRPPVEPCQTPNGFRAQVRPMIDV